MHVLLQDRDAERRGRTETLEILKVSAISAVAASIVVRADSAGTPWREGV
jgi:hypothetical protein